jgi:hypothetical protein
MHIVGILEREEILETTMTENFPQIHVRYLKFKEHQTQ